MKKLIATSLVLFTLICIFTGCRNSYADSLADVKVIDLNTTAPTEKPTKVRADETVKIKVPSDMVNSAAGGDIKKYAATYGYEIIENDDSDITLKMPGRSYSLMLSAISVKVVRSIGEILDSGDYPYLVELRDYAEDFSYILMLVNSEKYKKAEETPSYKELSDLIGLCGLYYQFFTKEKDNKCIVLLADSKTGEVVYRAVYTD